MLSSSRDKNDIQHTPAMNWLVVLNLVKMHHLARWSALGRADNRSVMTVVVTMDCDSPSMLRSLTTAPARPPLPSSSCPKGCVRARI